ncbi:MAG: hypothetical protein QHH02_03600, partial [Syntrophomonadaceae bacterium]|nr:hypothetical protein [Syntrophomonadaceae bacterium]
MPEIARRRTSTTLATSRILNIDLGVFITLGLAVILLVPALARGLFFLPDLLPVLMLVGVLFFLWWLDAGVKVETGLARLSLLDGLVLGMAGAYALSAIRAVDTHEAVLAVLKYFGYFAVYWLVSRHAVNHSRERMFSWLMYISALAVAIVGLAAAAGWLNYPGAFDNGVINGPLQYKNATAI